MADARTEAIEAMEREATFLSPGLLGDLLDAIPTAALVRLVIERGGLERAAGYHDVICPLFIWEHDPDLFDDKPGPCDCVPVYRLAAGSAPESGAQT